MTEEVGRKFTRVRHIQMLADKCVETFATKTQLENAIKSIPSKLSQLTNDTNYATVDQVSNTVKSEGGKINTIKVNGTDLSIDANKAVNITIPTKVSQLTNDSNYAATSALPTKLSQLINDSGFVTSSGVTSITCNGSIYNTSTAALGALVKSVTCSGTSVSPTSAGVLTINPVMQIIVNGTTINPSNGTATLTTQIQSMIDTTVGSVVTSALAASY